MPLITLTTDFGLQDAYVSALKAQLYYQLEAPEIVDISHLIEPFHIIQAAYVLGSVYRSFPQGSIHFVGINFNQTPEQDLIVAELNDHFFVCADNGFLSLFEPELKPTKAIALKASDKTNQTRGVEAIAHIHRGGALNVIGTPVTILKQLTQHMPSVHPKGNEIQGHVLHIDRFGNIVTNITKQLFQKVGRNRPFVIHARNHNFKEVFNDYHEAIRYDRPKAQREEAGKKLALFNAQGHLELAVFKGSPNYGGGASTLFGLSYLDPIRVAFINDA
jgi:S-adenosylmethionine hydrolase